MVTTIFPASKVPLLRRGYWSPAVDRAIEDVNADIRSWASERVIVCDTWQVLQQGGRVRPGFATDMLHLNASGYAALNQELTGILKNIPALHPSQTRASGAMSQTGSGSAGASASQMQWSQCLTPPRLECISAAELCSHLGDFGTEF